MTQWPENDERIDIISRNGPTGCHYPGTKHDADKPRYDLLPPDAIDAMARVLTFGADKYAPNQWRVVPDAVPRYQAAMLRHAFAMIRGEVNDTESAQHITCAAFLVELTK